MSIWADIYDRSTGDAVRKEDLHKGYIDIKPNGAAMKYKSFYTYDKRKITLTFEQLKSMRFHSYWLKLKDERFPKKGWRWGTFIITPLGDTGLEAIKSIVDAIVKKYEYVDGFACDDEKDFGEDSVTQKNQKMMEEILMTIEKRNLKIVGYDK